MGKGTITIEDVAKAAGVSRQTVSRVLNQRSNVSVASRENVQAAMAELGYTPNVAARRMGGSRSFALLALLEPQSADRLPLGQMVLSGIEACHEAGYQLIFDSPGPCASDAAMIAGKVRSMVRGLQPDGIILLPPFDTNAAIRAALKDSRSQMTGLCSSGLDDSSFAEEATRQLIALGHRQVGFITGEDDALRSQRRVEGYRRSLARSGSRAHRHFVAPAPADTLAAIELARSWLIPTIRPTAILTETVEVALAVHQVASDLKLRIPQDLSLLCLADSPRLAGANPPISVFHRPYAGLFADSCRRLIANSANSAQDTAPAAEQHEGHEGHELIDRHSTAKAPRAV